MQQIRLGLEEGLEEGLEVSYYNSPMYTAREMHKRRVQLEEDSAFLKDAIEKTQQPDIEGDIDTGMFRITVSKDGWYEYFFRTDLSRIPKELENGNLDYRDVEWFDTVDKGQRLVCFDTDIR